MLEKQFSLHLQDDLGRLFTLRGTIDRMDTCDNAAVIADYKTGSTTANLYSMLIGYHLQLIVYLLAVLRESKNALLPAAILYIYISGDTALSASVPSSPDELDEMPGKAAHFMSGYFNQDERILQNLDHAFLRMPLLFQSTELRQARLQKVESCSPGRNFPFWKKKLPR